MDIKTGEAVAADIPELQYKYDPANVKIVNTGSSWRMDFEADGTNLSGGPLEGNYKVIFLFSFDRRRTSFTKSCHISQVCI